MEIFKNKNMKSINVFNDYMYEFDRIYGYNYIVIDAEDQVFVWGRNMMGYLGVGNKDQVSEPVLSPGLSGKGLQQFFNGYFCMFAKTDQDEFYCWGDNDTGRLGIGETGLYKDRKPFKNESLSNKNILDIYCGKEQSAAIDRSGLVYFWLHIHAYENVNQKNIITPVEMFKFPRYLLYLNFHQIIEDYSVKLSLSMLKISQLDCGLHHFMALAEDKSLLFTWGKNTFGQLGTHTVRSSFEPIKIEHDNSIAKICCGALSSYYLTTDNCIYVCGKTLIEEENVMETFTKIYCEPFFDLMSIKPYYYILAKSEHHVYELGKFEFQFIRTSYSDYESYLCDKFQRTNGTFDYTQCPMEQISNKQTALDKLKMFPMNLKEKIKLCHVFDDTTGKNVIYVTHNDEVYVTGSNETILGNGITTTLYRQHKIDELCHIEIDRFFNGSYCMFAITKNDHVYCWGGNVNGILGLGYENSFEDFLMTEDWLRPKLEPILKGHLNTYSTVTAESTDSELHKKLSHLKPGLNQHLSGKGVNQIYCYMHCNFATTSKGQLYGWGKNILWNDPKIDSVTLPKKILFEQDCKIKKFSCGLNHFMALDEQGDVYGWGSNFRQELSNEMPLTISFKPFIVQSNVKDIICVNNNSYVLKNDNILLILGQVNRYLTLSKIPLLIEPNIDFIQINPGKELVIFSKTAVFEQVYRGNINKTSYTNFRDYLNDKFKLAFNKEAESSSQIQFENIQNFELTSSNENSNDQKSDLGTEINMFEDKREQIGQRFFKSDNMFDKYEILESIGAGSYGKVYKIRDNLSQRIFALKCIPLKRATEENDAIFTEIEILSKIQSDFIVKYYSADITNHILNIRMEFCAYYDLNTLRDLINTKNIIFSESSTVLIALDYFISIEILKEIAEALNYIHNLNPPIVHGDLKPNNIFITHSEKRFFKLGDFGLANMKNCGLQFDQADVRRYLAPELVKGDALTMKSDIYCLGVIGEELFKYDNLSEENMFIQFKDVEPNNRRDSSAFIADLDDNLSKNEQVLEVLKNLDENSIESNIWNRFFIDFLFVKLNLQAKKFLEKDTLIESASNLSRQFNAVSKIGHGQFASVYKVRDKLNDQTYAIKKINKKVLKLGDERELSREIEILSQLRNNKLVQYNNCWIESDHAYIQMEYCDGSLRSMLENKRICFKRVIDGEFIEMELNELSISCEILQLITQSLNCLHENNIIHRDLKPENILIKLSKQVLFKISDFGLSRFLNPDESSPTMKIGDIKYRAPEVDATKNYNLKADIYSLGKIFLDLLDIPFENSVPEDDDLIFGDESTDNYQDEVVKLIMDMTDEDKFDSRPNCYEILDRIKMLKLNWDRIRNLDLSDENMRNKLSHLELNDIFIRLMMKNYQVSIDQCRGMKSRKFKHVQKSAIGIYEQHYDEIELVATGGFGFIFKAKHKQDKQVYAIKKYYLGSMAINYREQRLSELRQFAKLDNIHIAQYKVSWLEKNIIYNQMEYCELIFGEIVLSRFDIFKRNKDQAMSVAEYFVFYELFREWVEALDFLHNQDPPLTSGKLNKPLISLNDRQHFIRLTDIQTRESIQYLNMAIYYDLKEIGQLLKNGRYIFDYDVTTQESLSIKSSEALRNKHDQIRELIFYKPEEFNISDNNEFVKKFLVEHANNLNYRANEPSLQYKLDYHEHGHIGDIKSSESEVTTKTLLAKLDQLMINEQELRQSQDLPLIISHLNVNEEIVYKIFEAQPCKDFIQSLMNMTRTIRNIMVSFVALERIVVIDVLKKFAENIDYLRVAAGNGKDLIEAVELVPNVVHLELVFLSGFDDDFNVLPSKKAGHDGDDHNYRELNLLRLRKLQVERCQHQFVLGMFNRLPADVLIEIALHQNNLNKLSHIFQTQRNIKNLTINNDDHKQAIVDADIFDNLQLEYLEWHAYQFRHENICTILTKQSYLQVLNKLIGMKISVELLNVITDQWNQLQTLAIGITHLPTDAIKSINKLVHLKDLTLQSNEENSVELLREFAAQDNTRITTLNIQHDSHDIPNDLIVAMARLLPNLKMVTFHCDYIVNTFHAILKNFNYVEALHLDASNIDYEGKDRTGNCYSLVKRGCDNSNLTELKISYPMVYTIKIIEKIVTYYPHLKRLVIFPTNRDFPAPFEAILKGFKELESFFILRSLMSMKKRHYDLDVIVEHGINLKFIALLDLELECNVSSIKENVRRKFGAIEHDSRLGLKMADGRITMKTEWEYIRPF